MKREEQLLKTIKKSNDFSISLGLIVLSLSLIVAGGIMNVQTILNNGCKMPVKTDNGIGIYKDSIHFSFINDAEINNSMFSDRIRIKNYIYSIGDFTIYFWAVIFLVSATYSIIFCYQLNKMKKALQ
jgi:hypothetical protein